LDKTGQYVNYKEMVRFGDEKIREGVIAPADVFNKHCNDHRKERSHFIIDSAAALIRVKDLVRDKQFPVMEGADEYEEAEEYVD